MSAASQLPLFSLLELLDKMIMFIDLFSEIDVKNNELFKIQKIDNKGYGMIAAQNIDAFTVILIEKPLLMEPINMTISLEKHLYNQFINDLTKSQQSLILNLSNCNVMKLNENNDKEKLLGIYHTNCVGTGDSLYYKSGLFPMFARINHSCLPNCCMYYEGIPTNCIVLKSLFPINKGDEITIGYIPRLLHTFNERQEMLENNYGFKCNCNEMCALNIKYDDLIIEYRDCIKNRKDLKCIERAIDILNKDFNGYPSMMSHLYNICADICINKRLYENAVNYIEKSINVHLKCYSIYKRDRWKIIRRKIVLMKYRNSGDSKYDMMLEKYKYLFET